MIAHVGEPEPRGNLKSPTAGSEQDCLRNAPASSGLDRRACAHPRHRQHEGVRVVPNLIADCVVEPHCTLDIGSRVFRVFRGEFDHGGILRVDVWRGSQGFGHAWILMYSTSMRICPSLVFMLGVFLFSGCTDPISIGVPPGTGGTVGTGGTTVDGGLGGMGGSGAAGGTAAGDCNETGCDDGNACTVDAVCNTLTGVCVGGDDDAPINAPCNQNGGFVCDGEGACVVCNEDAQCARFFPPTQCRAPAACVNHECPIPEPLPDGSPCDDGQCFEGQCVAVVPQRKSIPIACDNSNSDGYWELSMVLTVGPTAVEAARTFDATIRTSLVIPRAFVQFAMDAVFPTELTTLEIDAAGAEVVTTGVLSGSPVSTRLPGAPLVIPIPQTANPNDPQGPNLATDDITIALNPILAATYRAEASGEVCFDAGGAMPPSTIGAPPLRTGIRAIASNGAVVRFECTGGTVDDGATIGDPFDDSIVPNPPSSQICFPIAMPEVDLCEGPAPIDCASDDQCVTESICDPFSGTCAAGEDLPRGAPCSQDGGTVCDGGGRCVECVESAQCPDDGNQCTSDPACVSDRCAPLEDLPQGTVCNSDGGDRCDGEGNCIFVGNNPFPQTEALTLGCTNNIDSEVWLVPFELTVAPETVRSGQPFVVDLDGVATVPETLLDSLQWVIPGGAARIDLIDVRATTHLRMGATGGNVVLEAEPIPRRCAIGDAVCDPRNDLPGLPGRRANSDCVPVGSTNPCGRFVEIPTSDDCGAGGVCADLDDGTGTKLQQCDINGFCVTSELRIPLAPGLANYVAATAGEVLFGWDDATTGATLGADGAWELPVAVFEEPIVSNGIRISVEGLSVALECTMGVDSDGIFGVGVPGESSPTPDLLLIGFPIQAP